MQLETLRDELRRLPPDERLAMLVLSCVELDQDALAAPLNLVGVAAMMGSALQPHQRKALASRLRAAAVKLERFPRHEIEVTLSKFKRATA